MSIIWINCGSRNFGGACPTWSQRCSDCWIVRRPRIFREEQWERKSKKRKIRLTSRRSLADRINEIIAKYECTTTTAYHPPCGSICRKWSLATTHAKYIFLSPILLASFPLWHVMLDGPYQAVRIIPDKTVDKRYVARISESKSTMIFNTQGNYVRLLCVRSQEIAACIFNQVIWSREIIERF